MTSRVLGAILAGGQARRFGADKAAADLGGQAMLDRVAGRLRPQCAALVVVGRDWPGLTRVDDRPGPGLGPLGGLAGALDFAARQGFDLVLTSGCDLPDLPDDLVGRLGHAPALAQDQPLVGLWPAALAAPLLRHLQQAGDRSLRRWADRAGARRVVLGPIANINTPAELAAYRERRPRRP